MGTRKKRIRKQRRTTTLSRRPATFRLVVVAAALVVVAAAMIWWSGAGRESRSSQTPGTGTELASFETAQRLIGRWQRADADYVIEIREIDGSGAVDAGYFNPNSIHVSRAKARDNSGGIELFVELNDVGYPGATYRLLYSPEQDIMTGLYYQPTAEQTFEVVFKRQP